jgi:hypothetical protein
MIFRSKIQKGFNIINGIRCLWGVSVSVRTVTGVKVQKQKRGYVTFMTRVAIDQHRSGLTRTVCSRSIHNCR